MRERSGSVLKTERSGESGSVLNPERRGESGGVTSPERRGGKWERGSHIRGRCERRESSLIRRGGDSAAKSERSSRGSLTRCRRGRCGVKLM